MSAQRIIKTGDLPTPTKAVLYTVPDGQEVEIENIRLVNTNAAARDVNLYVTPVTASPATVKQSGGASVHIIEQNLTLAANADNVVSELFYLFGGDSIEGDATGADVEFCINGKIVVGGT